jgi:hypothetical protein
MRLAVVAKAWASYLVINRVLLNSFMCTVLFQATLPQVCDGCSCYPAAARRASLGWCLPSNKNKPARLPLPIKTLDHPKTDKNKNVGVLSHRMCYASLVITCCQPPQLLQQQGNLAYGSTHRCLPSYQPHIPAWAGGKCD